MQPVLDSRTRISSSVLKSDMSNRNDSRFSVLVIRKPMQPVLDSRTRTAPAVGMFVIWLFSSIIYQRLTDYVPMLLILFMLKNAAKTLQHQMLEMRNRADVAKLLKEDSEQGRRRADLKKRLERLTEAQELINNRS